MPDNAPERPKVACPRCGGQVRIHPSTNRIPEHKERGEKTAPRCSFSGDYLPGFTPPTPIRPVRGVVRLVAAALLVALSACGAPSGITIADGPPPSLVGQAYNRDAFGEPWVDVDGNDCDTRNDILQRDLDDEVLDTDGCTVLAGILTKDAYTGRLIYFERGRNTSIAVQIDHVIPLSWAWRHGADAWTPDQRVAFANDPKNLIAVDGPTNEAKGDSGPSDWVPQDDPCWYQQQWQNLIEIYRLRPNSEDRAAIAGPCADVPR